MSSRQLYVHRYPAAHPEGRPTLLFVHGAYMDSRCWDIHFLPYFAALGYNIRVNSVHPGGIDTVMEQINKVFEWNATSAGSWSTDDYMKRVKQVVDAQSAQGIGGNGRVSYELLVRLSGDAPVGYLRDQLQLTTNDRRATQFPVNVEGRIAAA